MKFIGEVEIKETIYWLYLFNNKTINYYTKNDIFTISYLGETFVDDM